MATDHIDGTRLVTLDDVARLFGYAMANARQMIETESMPTSQIVKLDTTEDVERFRESLKMEDPDEVIPWFQFVADRMNQYIREGKDPHSIDIEQTALDFTNSIGMTSADV